MTDNSAETFDGLVDYLFENCFEDVEYIFAYKFSSIEEANDVAKLCCQIKVDVEKIDSIDETELNEINLKRTIRIVDVINTKRLIAYERAARSKRYKFTLRYIDFKQLGRDWQAAPSTPRNQYTIKNLIYEETYGKLLV